MGSGGRRTAGSPLLGAMRGAGSLSSLLVGDAKPSALLGRHVGFSLLGGGQDA